ncbi:MAG: hypothetical protein IJ318_02350 [Clostridia bacterium]|nr:hypothetical protein [Clostridia bacterium]
MKEFNKTSNIDDLIKISLDRVKALMETNTIVGEAIKVDAETSVIPISKASVGFVVGGGEYADKSNRRVANHFPMAGGSGCGMSVSPVGFIVITTDDIKFIDIENKSVYQTVLNMINKIIAKIDSNKEENNEGKK